MLVCWSTKGGSGTTVIAAALSLVLARTRATLLVDLCGDAPAALGLAEPSGPGVFDWLASPTADTESLRRLSVPATDQLQLAPAGQAHPHLHLPPVEPLRWSALGAALAGCGSAVVVDAGVGAPPAALCEHGARTLLVTRPCYLALRRVVSAGRVPDGVVLLREPGRTLLAADIERAVGAPVVAELHWDPTVARAVDAGLLASRLPRALAHPLRDAA